MAENTTPEGRVKSACIAYLKRNGWLVEINTQGAYTRGKASGRPDMQATKPILPGKRGLTIQIEVKRPVCKSADGKNLPAGKLSDLQKEYIERLDRAGVPVLVVWSVEELIRDVREIETRVADGTWFRERPTGIAGPLFRSKERGGIGSTPWDF